MIASDIEDEGVYVGCLSTGSQIPKESIFQIGSGVHTGLERCLQSKGSALSVRYTVSHVMDKST
jgi:hypothetical protein